MLISHDYHVKLSQAELVQRDGSRQLPLVADLLTCVAVASDLVEMVKLLTRKLSIIIT